MSTFRKLSTLETGQVHQSGSTLYNGNRNRSQQRQRPYKGLSSRAVGLGGRLWFQQSFKQFQRLCPNLCPLVKIPLPKKVPVHFEKREKHRTLFGWALVSGKIVECNQRKIVECNQSVSKTNRELKFKKKMVVVIATSLDDLWLLRTVESTRWPTHHARKPLLSHHEKNGHVSLPVPSLSKQMKCMVLIFIKPNDSTVNSKFKV